MFLTLEQLAREKIDAQLAACGWAVQDYAAMDFSAGRASAFREVPLKASPCDSVSNEDDKTFGRRIRKLYENHRQRDVEVFNEEIKVSDSNTSTEFYVVTPKPDLVATEYLHAIFFCSFVLTQTGGKTTGSSGRRRERARALRAETEVGWPEAKRWFEAQLLGSGA